MRFLKKLFTITSKADKEIEKEEVHLFLDNLFVHNFIKKGGKFLYCQEKKEVVEHIKSILSENNWNKILVTNTKLLPFLNEKEIKVASEFKKSIPFFTTCEHLIADNGEILFSSNQLNVKKLSDFPENFITYATTSQLVKNIGEGLSGIKANSKHFIPSNISSIKSYEINKKDDIFLNCGNSNTKNLYLLLLEDL